MAQVDMGRAVDDAVAALHQQISENGALVTRDELVPVQGDRLQLTQLFQNLISNGIKFRGKDAPRVHVSCAPSPRGHRFDVADNGIGIDPEFKERIFEMFHRLHDRERYSGHGIGLALCRRIVDRHGGRIWVEGKPDAGSRFCFTICPPGERDAEPGDERRRA
jgi:light-regulated signal transduction histidine kinase (bacteriophytochrome)